MARFCLACGAALGPAAVPVAEEERKTVTVLFCDLVGFTEASDQADPEDVRARIRPYHARLPPVIEGFGGTVEKFIGDAVMAVFGAPAAHEDDPERAVRAGLAILDAIAGLNDADAGLGLAVRVGVETGQAVVALGARPELGEGLVAGDVVNTASRVEGAAPVGGVLAGPGTYAATKEVFEYRPLEPVVLKGKAAPVPVWRAVAARARLGTEVTALAAAPNLATGLAEGVPATLPLGHHAVTTTRALLAEHHGHHGEAAALFADAAQRWEQFEMPWEQAQALLGQGRCLFALGQPNDASQPLRTAREILASLGAKPSLADANRLLAQTTTASA
jgi:class 3 adenylate cyclase